jgi:GNAT superfamily N-acetyltransferase
MEHVLRLARERRAVRVELTTNVRRTRAQQFYTRLGFVVSHVGMKYYLGEEA